MTRRTRTGALAAAALLASASLLTLAAAPAGASRGGDWPVAGQNIENTRDAAAETTISPANVAGLKVKWSLTTNGDVFDTPAVSDGVAYFTDSGSTTVPSGTLWAVDVGTGHVKWSRPISSYTGIPGDDSRTTPAIADGLLILGDQAPQSLGATGAWLFAVNAATGNLAWKTQLDSNPAAVVTASPSVYGSLAFAGVSSYSEEDATGVPGFQCCTFRGSLVALNVHTGQIVWKTYMVPPNDGKTGGYSGGAIWGSSPAIDPANHMVYVGTGNTYTVPAGICTQPDETGCTAPAASDHEDSIVALNLFTGKIIWSTPTLTADVFNTACTNPAEECGPDFDFGSGPNVYTTRMPAGAPRTLVGIGQKSGMYYALDPGTGQIVWQTKVGPGTSLGGIQWGTATDGTRIYAAESDFYGLPYTVNGKTVTGGSWAALNAATGQILWQTPDPQGAPDLGFMSVANGVVYAPSYVASGTNMYALNAATGAIGWSYASGGGVIAGAAIVNGTVYWGSGYKFADNDKLYAFGL
jgi:polyvinyl alcohol dehydrogenase (cytochrome)